APRKLSLKRKKHAQRRYGLSREVDLFRYSNAFPMRTALNGSRGYHKQCCLSAISYVPKANLFRSYWQTKPTTSEGRLGARHNQRSGHGTVRRHFGNCARHRHRAKSGAPLAPLCLVTELHTDSRDCSNGSS